MERFLVLAVLLATFDSSFVRAQNNTTTVEDLFLDRYGATIDQVSTRAWKDFENLVDRSSKALVDTFTGKPKWLPFTLEVIRYFREVTFNIMAEFGSDLGNLTLHSITHDLNDHCGQYLERPIEDLTVVPSNVTCVFLRLRSRLTSKMRRAIGLGVRKLSRDCRRQLLDLCSVVPANCTTRYEERIGKLLTDYVQDDNELVRVSRSTPLDVVKGYVTRSVALLSTPYSTAYSFLLIFTVHISSSPSTEPFSFVNLVHLKSLDEVMEAVFKNDTRTQTQEQLTWGIVRSRAGSKDHICARYREVYPRGSQHYLHVLFLCNHATIYQSTFDLLRCAYTADVTKKPLTWSTVHSAYFHSQCLCLAFEGAECGVKAPQGVDPRLYCLSVLLRDFQRQVSYRPAVTYLDYAYKTRVPVCQFVNFFQIGFRKTCAASQADQTFPLTLSVQCYFQNLVSKRLNCSERLQVTTYNATVLCTLQIFMEFVICEGDDGDALQVRVPYYAPGDSTLVRVLTYVDVSLRVLTLVTYLACPQLRNLPGKLLIGYQATALLRLVAVRASLEDLALAVRLDVVSDLASTLWLTAYLHFLMTSIKTLRLPDSLTTYEALVVLLRYALFGWALPAALSAIFFWMDEALLDSRLMVGQLLFVLCNYAALLTNLYMFFYNSHFYYDVKKGSLGVKVGVTARTVFLDLFNFALKTSLLSGAGIIFRLIFTQIQGLEHLLSYYHALSTLHGLLLFFLYGCNREAIDFWRLVLSKTLPLCSRQNNSP